MLWWHGRFAAGGPTALEQDAARGPSPRRPDPARIKAMAERTLDTTPPEATHRSTRTLARACGGSHMMVARMWKAHGLQPHRVRTFKWSRDPALVQKRTDVVGLYLNPPDKALVLWGDEKRQIQALDRTQPGLPRKPGRGGPLTHDDVRQGTPSLLAVLNGAEGRVIGGCLGRHEQEEFLRFLRQIERQTPPELALHLIVDNDGTPQQARVRPWLAAHPRFRLHFPPTGGSWLNRVAGWLGELTRQRIRRGSFRSVAKLVAALEDHLRSHNETPRPLVWTKRVEESWKKAAVVKLPTLHDTRCAVSHSCATRAAPVGAAPQVGRPRPEG